MRCAVHMHNSQFLLNWSIVGTASSHSRSKQKTAWSMNVKLHLANRKIDEKLILCLKTIWRTFFLRLKIARLAIPIGQAVAVCEYASRRHFDYNGPPVKTTRTKNSVNMPWFFHRPMQLSLPQSRLCTHLPVWHSPAPRAV